LSAAVRSLAIELAPKGVRVNAICPSNVKTPLYDAGAAEINGEEALNSLLSRQVLGLGMPEQIAEVAAFLLSDASSFITGVNLPVDGGYLAQ
jgi:NAD(P)-dependent dehydrogenase (short-subunit alcohol dehydrogenase family)